MFLLIVYTKKFKFWSLDFMDRWEKPYCEKLELHHLTLIFTLYDLLQYTVLKITTGQQSLIIVTAFDCRKASLNGHHDCHYLDVTTTF